MATTRSRKASARSYNSSSRRPRKRRLKPEPKRLSTLDIKTLGHLAHHLGCDVKELRKWSSCPEDFFVKGIIEHPVKPRPKCTPKSPRLKKVLGNLNDLLQRLEMDPAMHGGRRGRSPLTNAKPHIRQHTLIKLDIENFFPSITRVMVKEALIFRAGCSPEVGNVLAAICTPFDQLPQGSPHSSMTAALVVDRLVRRLRRLTQKHGGSYSQYVDDSAISGPPHIDRLQRLAIKIIESEGLKANSDKTNITRGDSEKVVTGFRVDKSIDIPSERIDALKRDIEAFRSRRPTDQEITSIEGRLSYYASANKGAAKQLRRQMIRHLRIHGIFRE